MAFCFSVTPCTYNFDVRNQISSLDIFIVFVCTWPVNIGNILLVAICVFAQVLYFYDIIDVTIWQMITIVFVFFFFSLFLSFYVHPIKIKIDVCTSSLWLTLPDEQTLW